MLNLAINPAVKVDQGIDTLVSRVSQIRDSLVLLPELGFGTGRKRQTSSIGYGEIDGSMVYVAKKIITAQEAKKTEAVENLNKFLEDKLISDLMFISSYIEAREEFGDLGFPDELPRIHGLIQNREGSYIGLFSEDVTRRGEYNIRPLDSLREIGNCKIEHAILMAMQSRNPQVDHKELGNAAFKVNDGTIKVLDFDQFMPLDEGFRHYIAPLTITI